MARKKNQIDHQELLRIKQLVQNKCGYSISRPIDCKKLSTDIISSTGEYISDSTLKRFFGFYPSSFSHAFDTIRILENYCKQPNKKFNESNIAIDLILSIFDPPHFQPINPDDTSFQASCRSVAMTIKKNPQLFEAVMDNLAKSENGRKYYYELFPDYEILSSFQYKGYLKYLMYEKSYQGILFAHCILFVKYFFEQNESKMKEYWEIIKKIYKKGEVLHPYVLGRYYQVLLISAYHFNKKEIKSLIRIIFETERNISREGNGLFLDFPGFHYFVCDGLYHISANTELHQLSSIALEDFKRVHEFEWKGYYDQLMLYKALANFNIGNKIEAQKIFQQISPDKFYFISANFFRNMYDQLSVRFKKA